MFDRWHDIIAIGSQVETCHWFCDGFVMRIGNGCNAMFWFDLYIGGSPFAQCFRHLFLVSMMTGSITEIGHWEGDLWCCNLRWHCNLFAQELDLMADMLALLTHANLQRPSTDAQVWSLHAEIGFTTKSIHDHVYVELVHVPDFDANLLSALKAIWKSPALS